VAATKPKTKAKPAQKPGAIQVTITHADRPVYPADGITKQDVADYFAAVADPMLHALAGRPLALQHWQKGIGGVGFYHQHIGKEAQPWMTFAETPAKSRGKGGVVRHLIADRPEALQWMAQYSALTVHMWHSHVPTLDSPDWVLFDLDPADGETIEQAIPVALKLAEMLDQRGLESIPKTSGKRGIHVFVPLAPGHTYDQAQSFALAIAEDIVWSMEDDVTLERMKDKRGGRLYFDCLQNARAKMVVAPYSLRGIAGAPVSAPLTWDEVKPGLDPKSFNLKTMPARLKAVGDLFAGATSGKAKLP
jgi:bifunctional non-homologous end joining protein LigD